MPQAGSVHPKLAALSVTSLLFVLVLCLDVYCLVSLVRAKSVRNAPKLAWVVAILLLPPLGALLYLFLGMDHTTAGSSPTQVRGRVTPLRWLAVLIRNLVFVVAGIPVQLVGPGLLALPWVIPHYVPVSFWLVLGALLLSAGLVLLARVPLTFVERHRCWSMLGVHIPPPAAAQGTSLPRRFVSSLRSEATWRQLGYHLVVGPVMAAGGLLALGLLAGGIELEAPAVYGYSALFFPLHGSKLDSPKAKVITSAVGVVLLLLVPVVVWLVTRLDRVATTSLLGPSRSVELERRVETLSQSRAGVVDAADAERRRIERDLHDGAQQRLVSLAMNLGIARETLTDLPAEAKQVIDAAHDEAKEALADLRNLVRGLHPAVLDDRGLDAALSGIAARAPLPVRLSVDTGERASPTVEAVAYFVVSECLANIARHSAADQAAIEVRRIGNMLRIQITDDGVGGADPSRGSGLASLARRAKSVDGKLRIDSPAGGPTAITVELPCE
jgi:signal transduction histidine kinase